MSHVLFTALESFFHAYQIWKKLSKAVDKT